MSVELVEVEIPFAGIEAISVEIVNATGPPGTPCITSLTPPSNTSALWFDPSDGSVSAWNGTVWVTTSITIPNFSLTFNGGILTLGGDTLTFQIA